MSDAPSASVEPQPSENVIRGVDPWSSEPLPPVDVTSVEELTASVEQARAAQKNWASLQIEERVAVLKRVAKRLLRERHEGLRIVEQELGKVPADALFTEGLGPLDAVLGWARVIERAPWGKVSLNPVAFPKKQARLELTPRGVVAVIAPWNFPVAGLYRSTIPALLLGNAVVVKPSERSPRSSGWFLRILMEELPTGLVAVVNGAGNVGAQLLEQDIDACVFTGSTKVGEQVERICFDRGIACSAEMGGNDAAIVLDDANLPRTVAGLTHWALQNAGQACGAVEVVYADSRIADELARRLAEAFSKLQPSKGPSGSVAPLAYDGQLERVQQHVAQAREAGATLVCGGTAEGRVFRPTVLAHCNDDMDIVREETFGPVLPVVSVDGPADALRRINRSKYGLTASIWTEDHARGARLAERLDVGVVTVNNHAFTGAIVDLPWAGRRASGRGIANSAWSLLTFARPKAVVVDTSHAAEPFWAPFDEDLVELGHLLADAQLGKVTRAYKIPLLLAKRVKKVGRFFGIK